MAEDEFWNNLDNFVEQNKNADCVGTWLNSIPDITRSEPPDSQVSSRKSSNDQTNEVLESESSSRPNTPATIKNIQKNPFSKDKKKFKSKKGKHTVTKKVFETTKTYARRSKLRPKRRTNKNRDVKYFGPQVECKLVKNYNEEHTYIYILYKFFSNLHYTYNFKLI